MSAAERINISMMLLSGAMANGSPSELWNLARITKLIDREIGQVVGAVLV